MQRRAIRAMNIMREGGGREEGDENRVFLKAIT